MDCRIYDHQWYDIWTCMNLAVEECSDPGLIVSDGLADSIERQAYMESAYDQQTESVGFHRDICLSLPLPPAVVRRSVGDQRTVRRQS